MTRIGGVRRPRRGSSRLLLSLALALAGLGAGGVRAHAQYEPVLAQRQLDYDAARSERDSRKAEWEALQQRFQVALESVNTAKRSGNREREEAAYQQAQMLALELRRLATRLEAADGVLAEARRALEEAVDLQRDALADRLPAAPPSLQASLATSIRGLDAQSRELQAERGLRTQLSYYPAVGWDPRDGPAELRAKAQLLQRQIDDAQVEIGRVDEDVGRLQRRLTAERRAADAAASLNRFEDTNLPVGPSARTGRDVAQPGAPADASSVPLADRPLEDQIEALRQLRAVLVERQEQLRVRLTAIESRLTSSTVGEPS